MPELEPLPLSDAERIFLAHLLTYRWSSRQASLKDAQARLDDLSPAEYEFDKWAKIVRRISYAIAMCEVVADRLNVDIRNPPAWREDES